MHTVIVQIFTYYNCTPLRNNFFFGLKKFLRVAVIDKTYFFYRNTKKNPPFFLSLYYFKLLTHIYKKKSRLQTMWERKWSIVLLSEG